MKEVKGTVNIALPYSYISTLSLVGCIRNHILASSAQYFPPSLFAQTIHLIFVRTFPYVTLTTKENDGELIFNFYTQIFAETSIPYELYSFLCISDFVVLLFLCHLQCSYLFLSLRLSFKIHILII